MNCNQSELSPMLLSVFAPGRGFFLDDVLEYGNPQERQQLEHYIGFHPQDPEEVARLYNTGGHQFVSAYAAAPLLVRPRSVPGVLRLLTSAGLLVDKDTSLHTLCETSAANKAK